MRREETRESEKTPRAVVQAQGHLGEDGAKHVKSLIQTCLDRGDKWLVLDMRKVPYINTDGLRMLQDVLQEAETVDASVSLANVNSRVLRTLAITRMDSRVPIYNSLEEALTRD